MVVSVAVMAKVLLLRGEREREFSVNAEKIAISRSLALAAPYFWQCSFSLFSPDLFDLFVCLSRLRLPFCTCLLAGHGRRSC